MQSHSRQLRRLQTLYDVGARSIFKYRDSRGNIASGAGTVISNERITLDGLQVVEVQMQDLTRKYSLTHIREEQL